MPETRERWHSRGAFIMAAVGSAVGLGNVWRFPFVAYKSGGGAFFIPYLIALLTAGIPVMMLEYALGTRFQSGAPKALGQIHKGFKWVGWLAVLVALSITFYYIAIMAYSWRYMIASVDLAWEQPTSNQTVFKVPYILVDTEDEKESLQQEILDHKKGEESRRVPAGSANFPIAEVVVKSDLDEFVKERLSLWDLEPGQAMSADRVLAYAREYYEQGLHETRFDDVEARVFVGPWDQVDGLEARLAEYYAGLLKSIRDGSDKTAELRIDEARKVRTITLDANMKLFRDEVALGGFEAGKWFRQGAKNQALDAAIEELSKERTDLENIDTTLISGLSVRAGELTRELTDADEAGAPLPASEKAELASLLEKYYEDNTDEVFAVDWTLVLWAAVTWVIIFLIIFKGVGVVGKVVMITVPLPVLCLGILIVHGLTLPGAGQGINFLLTPDWDVIRDTKVWFAAYGQIFFSLSLGFGILIAYASYLPKDSDVSNNAFMTSFCNCATSFYASFAVFSVLGYLAGALNAPPDQVVSGGPGLVFVTYPVALTEMGGLMASIVGVLFFLSLLSLGIDSAFSIAEAVVTGVKDFSPKIRKTTITAVLCVVGFLITAVPYCLRSGLIWLDINDNWMSNYGLVLVGLLECIAVAYFFKVEKVREWINATSEILVHVWWDVFIKVVTPAILVYLFVDQITTNLTETYEDYDQFLEHSVNVWGWGYFAVLFLLAFLLGRNWKGLVGFVSVSLVAVLLNLGGVAVGGAVMAGIAMVILFGGFIVCLRIAMGRREQS
ncbi:MAG: SLC5/6 family protein, partial [Planctomycetota bacterium]|jgi:SNF family Na+-dependent transporter